MDITLTPELERRIRERIARGDYDNAESLVEEAVRRLIEEEESDLDALREHLRQADAEIDRGEGLEYDDETGVNLAEDGPRS